MPTAKEDGIRNIVVIGDTHCGGSTALLPPGVSSDEGRTYGLSPFQKWLWESWQDFWKWIWGVLDGASFAFVHLGDILEGRHHETTQIVTGNLSSQQRIALEALSGPVAKAKKAFFVRGTRAHSGESAESEEELVGQLLGKSGGPHTTWDKWLWLGNDLIHFAHHIPHTSSHAYKSSPLMRLMAASFAAAGEHGFHAPSILVRGHCHDYTEVKRAHCRVVTCPCWQGKTGHIWRIATVEPAVIGGLLIRHGRDGVHIRERIYTEPRPAPEVLYAGS